MELERQLKNLIRNNLVELNLRPSEINRVVEQLHDDLVKFLDNLSGIDKELFDG